MNISANTNSTQAYTVKEVKTNFTEKISKEEVADIKAQIAENTKAIMFHSSSLQSTLVHKEDAFEDLHEGFGRFLDSIGYSGEAIAELSQDEASELVSEDGFFGIDQTSQRIANFVIQGASGDEDMLRAGREGMLRGFKEAESIWGAELPDISQQTMQKSIEILDKVMHELGFSIVDTEV